LFDAVLKPRSTVELARLVDVEFLPECDPRLSDSLPGTSIYSGVSEVVKTAIAAHLAAQTAYELKGGSEKAVGSNSTSDDSVPQAHEDAAESRTSEKSRVASSAQKTPRTQSDISSSKQSTFRSRRHRTAAKDADRSLYTEESVNENQQFSVTLSTSGHRTVSRSTEWRSERSATKTHISRKRKRKDFDELLWQEDDFPLMDYLLIDEAAFSQHLLQLSLFAELDHSPDDPMLLISLCELDDIAAFQRQDFVSDLNSTFIGRKPRFSTVRSPYSDRMFNRLGNLSLQTYCDGHFIECVPVSQVHMTCLHRWASTEPLEKVVCNMWQDEQMIPLSVPYPSVRYLSDVLCYWLSDHLCCLMSDAGIKSVDPPDIFIGSSRQSELTTNCLHQMFCRYVDYLCEKAEKYLRDVDYGRVAVHADLAHETYANNVMSPGGKHARVLKQTSPSLRKKAIHRQRTKEVSRRQKDFEREFNSVYFELEKSEFLEEALPEKGWYDDDVERDAGYSHRKAGVHRKRRLPADYRGDEDWSSDLQSKSRKVHGDRMRLTAKEKENEPDVHWKKDDVEKAKQEEPVTGKSTEQDMPVSLKNEDSPDFMVYDEDGSIVVQCSDTGDTVTVEEATAGTEAGVDELSSSAVGKTAASLNVTVELSKSNSSLYSVALDHSYSTVSLTSAQLVTSVESDCNKHKHLPAIIVGKVENDNLTSPVMLPGSTDAGKNAIEVPMKTQKLADSKKPQLPLLVVSPGKLPDVSEKVVDLTKERNKVADGVIRKSQGEKIMPSTKKTPRTRLDIPSSKHASETTGTKLRPLSSLSTVSISKASAPRREVNDKRLSESPKKSATKEAVMKSPVPHKKIVSSQQHTVDKHSSTAVHKKPDVRKNKYPKVNKSEVTEAPKASRKEDSIAVSVSKERVSSVDEKTVVSPSKTDKHSTHKSEIQLKKVSADQEKRAKVSGEVNEAPPAKVVESEKASVEKTAEAVSTPAEKDSKVTNAEISSEESKVPDEPLPSAATLAATARAASHYVDGYVSEMADAYGVWPVSNFDPSFDPTSVPDGHMYNPFRRTWPILQHVVDGKTDLLLKVCSFPDVISFSLRRVMRESGFLWAVCLSLFDPTVSKPDSIDILDLNAAGKMKGAKSSNPLMQAFRQAVEAKKKVAVAAKSKLPPAKKSLDDAGETLAWSMKRPTGKMSIVFGSGVKSGGSLSSVVVADRPKKSEPAANTFSNLLTSAISKLHSDLAEVMSRKCGEESVDKDSSSTEHRSSLPATSKHLNALSEMTMDMYDMAEYKLEKIYASKDAEEMKRAESIAEDSKPVAASPTSAEVTATVAADAAAAVASVLVSTPASTVIGPSPSLLSSVQTSVVSTAAITSSHGSISADVKLASASAIVSQPGISQMVAAKPVASSAASITAGAVSTTSAAIAVKSCTVATTAAVSVTVKVAATTVADMPPPPMPPLSLSRDGVGFGSVGSRITTSGGPETLTSLPPSLASAATTSVGHVPTSTLAVSGFAYPPSVSTQQPLPVPFPNPPLPLDHLMHVRPPAVQPNLYPVPPPVGIPLNIPHPGFVDTSVPPPPVVSFSSTPWYPSSSTAGGANATVPVSGFQHVPDTAVSCASLPGRSQISSVMAAAGSSVHVTSGAFLTTVAGRSFMPSVTSMATPSSEQQNATSLARPLQRPPIALTQISQTANSTVLANSVSGMGVLPPLPCPPDLRQNMAQQGSAGTKSATSFLVPGNRHLGPLKVISPITQPRISGTVPQVRPVPSTASGLTGEPGFYIPSGPLRPVGNSQSSQLAVSSPLVGPRTAVRPGQQSAQTTLPVGQPRGAVRPPLARPGQPNSQLAAAPVIGQGPLGVPARALVSPASQPRTTLPDSRPCGPVSTRPGQPSVMGQTPSGIVRPQTTRPALSGNAPVRPPQLSVASTTLRPPPVRTGSQAQVPAGTSQLPRLPAAVGGQLKKGPLLTGQSRVYILNSDSIPLCKVVEVSLRLGCQFVSPVNEFICYVAIYNCFMNE